MKMNSHHLYTHITCLFNLTPKRSYSLLNETLYVSPIILNIFYNPINLYDIVGIHSLENS